MLRDLNRLIDINTLFRGQRDIIWFIKEMNSNANKFGLLSTFYDSPHGLSNSLNYSTAEDQWILISHLMKDELFRKIVSTQSYICSSITSTYEWQNTNQLLSKGFIGVKTGISDTAGPWIAACIDREFANEKLRIILVALNWKSIMKRWKDVPKLVNWWLDKVNEQISDS